MTLRIQQPGGTAVDASPTDLANIRADLSVPSITEATTAASSAAASAVAAHNAASDPHSQYLSQTEGDGRYVRTVNGTAPDGAGNVVVGGAGGATNLTLTRNSTTVTVVSDTGTDAVLPVADASNAGVMSAAQATRLAAVDGDVAAALSAANAKVQNSLSSSTTIAPSADAVNTALAGKAANVLTGLSTASAADVVATDTVLVGMGKLQAKFAAFGASVLGTVLTGLSTATSTVVAATDTVLVAIGKLQAQVSLKANAAAAAFTGITTFDGATVTTASAMGALAIDVTKGLNTKSIAVDSTLTFSATPATANTWFQVAVTNTDTNPHILTFPSAFSQVNQAARTSCPIAASGRLVITFRYTGAGYEVFGDGGFLNNFAASTAPTAGDDVADGYGPGSLWGDTTANTLYWCESNGAGAAVWNAISGGGGGSDTVTSVAMTVPAFLSIAGSPVTTAGTLAVTLSGTALPVANGGTGQTTAAAFATTLQGTGSSVSDAGFRGMPQNSQSAAYTCVLADSGKHILHPSADTTARTFTIPANATVAYPVGTALTFVNQNAGGAITIAITTDTMRLAGAGTTGSRTLAANGIATAIKLTATEWIINGTGLT